MSKDTASLQIGVSQFDFTGVLTLTIETGTTYGGRSNP